MNKIKLPMRLGVGVIVLNNENKIFVGKRKDNPVDKWQMPQGGVDIGENYLTAMKRELAEETSIKSIKILRELEGFFEYELPNNLVGVIWKGKFRGQKQKWFIAKFVGEEKEIDLKTKNPEFIDWKWIFPEQLPEVIVDFKREMYLKILDNVKKFNDTLLVTLVVLGVGLMIAVFLQVNYGLLPLNKIKQALFKIRNGDKKIHKPM